MTLNAVFLDWEILNSFRKVRLKKVQMLTLRSIFQNYILCFSIHHSNVVTGAAQQHIFLFFFLFCTALALAWRPKLSMTHIRDQCICRACLWEEIKTAGDDISGQPEPLPRKIKEERKQSKETAWEWRKNRENVSRKKGEKTASKTNKVRKPIYLHRPVFPGMACPLH